MVMIYTILWALIILLSGIFLLLIGIFRGEKIGQRLGIWANVPKNAIWIHASSMGESAEAATLARSLKKKFNAPIILSSTTITGYIKLHAELSDGYFIYQQPIDFPPLMYILTKIIRPQMLVIIESDMWLGMIWAARRAGAKVIVASGRLSDRTVRRAQKWRSFFKAIFSRIDHIFARTEEDARRFVEAGAPEHKVSVGGDLKLAASIPTTASDILKPGRSPIIVFGSVREKEEKLVIGSISHLLEKLPNALFIVAPRHPERFEPFCRALAEAGIKFARRSQAKQIPAQVSVYVLDTVGELKNFYSIADIAVIGGTFADYGGHNPFEATVWGVPVVHGKYVANNRTLFEMLDTEGAALLAESSAEALAQKLLELASSPQYLAQLAQRAQKISRKFQNLPEQYAKMLAKLLDEK